MQAQARAVSRTKELVQSALLIGNAEPQTSPSSTPNHPRDEQAGVLLERRPTRAEPVPGEDADQGRRHRGQRAEQPLGVVDPGR